MSTRETGDAPFDVDVASGVAGKQGLRRAGDPWRPLEDEQLIAGLRSGSSVQDLAEEHQRSTGAISSRLSKMVLMDDEAPDKRTGRVEWLRERLRTEPAYDWRTPLLAALSPAERPWSESDDESVRQGWADRRAIYEIADDLAVSEAVLTRRLVSLGLATDIIEVTDRLPFAPGSVVAQRRALALNDRSVEVVVLAVMTGGELHHLSLHANHDDAKACLDKRLVELRSEMRRIDVAWTITTRTVDDAETQKSLIRVSRAVVQGSPV